MLSRDRTGSSGRLGAAGEVSQTCHCKPYPVLSSFPGRSTTTRARRDGAEWDNLLPWWPHLREDDEEEEGAGDY